MKKILTLILTLHLWITVSAYDDYPYRYYDPENIASQALTSSAMEVLDKLRVIREIETKRSPMYQRFYMEYLIIMNNVLSKRPKRNYYQGAYDLQLLETKINDYMLSRNKIRKTYFYK